MKACLLCLSVLLVRGGAYRAAQAHPPESREQVASVASGGSQSASGETYEISATGCLDKKAGKFVLSAGINVYVLAGHAAELAGHSGDEAQITGTSAVLPKEPGPVREIPVNVTSVRILHNNRPEGVHPALGPIAGWKNYASARYGVAFRFPRTFARLEALDPHISPNFVIPEGVVNLENFSFPQSTYANTNFYSGSFAAFVSPTITGAGICQAFASFWPKDTSSGTVRGTEYAQTLLDGVAAGTASSKHYFHVYQNGLCYEFVFDFNEGDGTGWDFPVCAIQRIFLQNEQELINAVLSVVEFTKPEFVPGVEENHGPQRPPVVTSFTLTPEPSDIAQTVRVAWATEAADYVQLRYSCADKVFVSGAGSVCGAGTDRNFPPNGSETLLLNNFNKTPAPLVLSLVPFQDGVAYPKRSKSVTVSVSPQR